MQNNNIEQFCLTPPTSSPQVARHMFTAKLTPTRYDDLDLFRQQIEQSKAGLHHQPYTNNKKSVFIYKCIFFGFALFFFILGMSILAIPIHGGFFFESSTIAKGVITGICTILSLISLTTASIMQTEREVVYQCARKAKAHLATIYGRKSLRLGLKRFAALFGKQRLKAKALRQMYHEHLDKINDKKDEALHLVQRIATAETLDKAEKETLLNQAIEEFNDKMHMLTHTFKHAAIPHYST